MPNYNKAITPTNIRIGEVRFSYANVLSPRAQNGSDPKYSTAILIDKSNTEALALIKEAINVAIEQGIPTKWGGTRPSDNKLKLPLHDGDIDKEDDDNYMNCMYFNASSKVTSKPSVQVLKDGKMYDALDEEDFYSGCYGVAVINFYPYNSNGSVGVSAGLNVVAKTRDGAKLSGGVSAKTALAGLYDD